MTRLAPALPLAALAALAGCAEGGEEPVEPVSPTEARALDEAAEMLDHRRPPPSEAVSAEQDQDKPAEGETAE